jgi:branched-subunit amino acid ABC-type transport system permease component
VDTDFVAQTLVIGLTQQAPLALAALGFAVLYRLTGLVNVAFAETITLGAYFGMWVNTTFGLGFLESMVPAAVGTGLLSVATYFFVFRPAKQRRVGTTELIIISFGLSVFLRHALQFVFGYRIVYFDVPPPTYTEVLGVGVTSLVALTVLLTLFIQRTRWGKQIRALANDEQLAQVSGINPLTVTVMVWFFAGIAGGLAGGFYGVKASVMPGMGWDRFLLLLLVVLVGGSRNIWGVVIAALGAGLVLAGLTLSLSPLYAELILLGIFAVILKRRSNPALESGKV